MKLSVHGGVHTHTLPNPMNSSSRTHIPAIPRRRKHRNSGVRRQCGILASPLFQWKPDKKHLGNSSPVNFKHGFRKSELSARKLAAGLWQLRFMEVSGHGGAAFGDGSFHSPNSELANGNVKITFPPYHNSGEKFKETKDQLRRPVTILRSRNRIRFKLGTSLPCLKCSKKAAAKWEHALSEASNEFTKIHSRNLLEDRKLVGDSVVTTLLAELLRAQRSINKLKAAQKSSKKKVEQFLQKLEEEKVFWKLRERQKIQSMLDDLKDKLERERRSRERMELLNAKLVHELAKANLSAKQFMTNCEEEKKERELIEEVCNELAMQIGEDKVKLEVLLRDSMKIREEVEEERKMLQMAELWREERVQMKLVDAKLALEDKYNQMIQLIAYLQTFLRSRGAELGTMELEDAQFIKQAAESVNIQRIVELTYDFSKSNDIFSIYEKLRNDNACERVIKPDSHPSLTGPLSTIHIVSLDEEGLNKNSVLHQLRPSSNYNTCLGQTNSSKTISHVEIQNFSSPPQRRDTYLDNVNQDKNTLGSEAERSEKVDMESRKTGVNAVCSVSAGQSKWKASSASKLLRSCPNDGTTSSSAKISQHKRPGDGWYKHQNSVAQKNSADLTFDECNRRLSTRSIQSGGITSTSLRKGSGEGGSRHSELLGQRNSRDTMNPHISRGMKGCIEWPRGIPKTNSKTIPLEERVRIQKSQLQHILKP